TERGEELLRQAQDEMGTRLAIAYNMLIESFRLRLPALKKRFNEEFNSGLAEPPTPEAAAAMLGTTAAHRLAGVTYHGQKTHEKKVLGYVDKVRQGGFTEAQLEKICLGLLGLKALRPLRTFTGLGRRQFPQNPRFPYRESESYFVHGPERCPPHIVRPLLEEARRLAEQMPRDPRQQQLLQQIQQRQQMIQTLNPVLEMFENFFSGGFD